MIFPNSRELCVRSRDKQFHRAEDRLAERAQVILFENVSQRLFRIDSRRVGWRLNLHNHAANFLGKSPAALPLAVKNLLGEDGPNPATCGDKPLPRLVRAPEVPATSSARTLSSSILFPDRGNE